jgi:hypothetical protein
MFSPNTKIRVQTTVGTNLYGQPKPGVWHTESCSIVRLELRSEKTSVRADTSATRGNARELQADLVLLMVKNTKACIDDILELRGQQFRIIAMQERYDTFGRSDHFEVSAQVWSKA